MHSIVGQGKVEQVLASKPEDRRAFVEEAAGLGKFKRRRHRAELKLARVALQVERARDVEEEVRKRLRPLALQATAAERAEKLGVEIAALARGSRSSISAIRVRVARRRRSAATLQRSRSEVRRGGSRGCSPTGRGPRTSSRTRRAGVRPPLRLGIASRVAASASSCVRSRPQRCSSGSASETPAAPDEQEGQSDLARLELDAIRTAEAARNAERERIAVAERAALVRERVRALEQALAEQEGLPPAARALAEDGARLALAALDIEPGAERAVAAALRARAAAVLADDPAVGLALLQRARAAGLGSLTVLAGRSPQDIVGEYPVVPLDALLDVTAPSVTPEGFGYDPVRGELWFVGETAEAVLLELQGRRTALAAEAKALEEELATATRVAEETAERARVAEAAFGRAPRLRATSIDAATLGRSSISRRPFATASTPLSARPGASRRRFAPASTQGRRGRASSARSCGPSGAAEVNLRRELEEASVAVTAAEVEIARIDAEVAEAARRLESAGDVEPAEGDDRDELAIRVERLEARRVTLGQVNPLAREEYETEKERLDDLEDAA